MSEVQEIIFPKGTGNTSLPLKREVLEKKRGRKGKREARHFQPQLAKALVYLGKDPRPRVPRP